MTTQPIELLAPAKDLETGIAAINCGADAVYIGAAQFGARQAAGNPLADIDALIDYAHRYFARVYVTLNTLLYDHELPAAQELAQQLYQAGADALILQDVGLLEAGLPPIPLFASTQMHNASVERIQFLEKVGFRRVILARELTLEQIRQVRQATSLELESFIHGALCVCYSGQCSLSYALGGRSGNRGQCAQPCRRRYRLRDGQGKILADSYLLSLRDLNLSDELDALLDAGITSFKIEGRLKDRAYVMNVVGHYRQRLDQLLDGRTYRQSSSGRCQLGFTPDIHKVFNRGFTRYFIHDRSEPVAAHASPKWLGEEIGIVVRVGQRSFNLESAAELHPGDGLTFFDGQGELRGTQVHRVEGPQVFVDKILGLAPGVLVYRNHDHEFLRQVEESHPERKITLTLKLVENDLGLALEAEDEDGVQATAAIECEKQAASKPEQAQRVLQEQLAKLGGTEFVMSGFVCATRLTYFLPLAKINELRRSCVANLRQARAAARPLLQPATPQAEAEFPEKTLSFHGNVLNQQAEAFYRRHGVSQIEPAAEAGTPLQGRMLMSMRYCIKYELGACPKQIRRSSTSQPDYTPAPTLSEPLTLIDENGVELSLRFNCARCIMEIYLGSAELV